MGSFPDDLSSYSQKMDLFKSDKMRDRLFPKEIKITEQQLTRIQEESELADVF
jgi:hypothetical protein